MGGVRSRKKVINKIPPFTRKVQKSLNSKNVFSRSVLRWRPANSRRNHSNFFFSLFWKMAGRMERTARTMRTMTEFQDTASPAVVSW